MSLSSIIAAVNARLPGVTAHMGPEFIARNEAPPRVVWVPSRDRYGPGENAGGNARQLRTRFAGCEVRVWGADYDATEALVNQVQAAIHAECSGSYQLEGEAGWLDTSGGEVNLGRVYLFHVVFKVPVTAAPLRTTPLTSIPQTVELNSEPV